MVTLYHYLGLGAVYASIALGMVLYGVVTAGSIALGAWRPRSHA